MKTANVAVDTSKVDTWPKVLEHNSTRFGGRKKAMRYKRYGIWQSYSWEDYLTNVKHLAYGLLSLGFSEGSKLLIVGDSSPEWYFAQLAAQSNRGVSVGLYSDLSAPEIEYVARNSEAEFAMVEDQEQVDKVVQIREHLPKLKTIIYWRYKGLTQLQDSAFIGLREVLERGRHYEAEHPGVFEANLAAGKATDVCSIIYTSGTSGDRPKGALHSYRSLVAGSEHYGRADKVSSEDNLISYLPPAWITEQWLGFGCHLLSGGTVNFPESSETQQEDIREIAPSLVIYNSRLWENQAGQVQARLQAAGRLKRLVTRSLMPVGYKMADRANSKQKPGWHLWLLNLFADLVVFRRVRDSLGLPHARVCRSTGSTLSPQVFRFFHAVGVPLKNIYGSTEAGAVTGAAEEATQSPGTAGLINPGVEVTLSDEGEIVVRHPGVFLGYHNDPGLTAQVLNDGWVRTGDKGFLTEDHELVFVDRLEDLIVLPCGDVLAPQEIESRLKYSPYIKDAWVLAAEGCEFVSAAIIIEAATTGRWADKRGIVHTTFGDLSQKAEVYELIEQEISLINQGLAPSRQVRRFVNLHKEFDPDEFELTRNRKLRRAFLAQRYSDLARALSGDQTSVEVEAQFTYQDGRTGMIRTALRITDIGRGGQ
ncbi:MAG: AMP-binding protein [Thermoleophilia bacterium]|nr:AMP-binding protein [Thermoleophilia bacterium]